jgi:hypothetical protein
VLGGCEKSTLKLHPVRGQVLFKDQPTEGATLVLLPAGDENAQYRGPTPYATVAADGSFEVYTDPHGTGAPAGEYGVMITWFTPRDDNNFNPKNRLPMKYANQEKPLLKVTVKEGKNDLEPFRLAP